MTAELIGRDEELSVVQAFLDRQIDGVRALVLEGEAGIGKSTLWLAGVEAARERSFQVLASRPAEAERTLANVVLGDLFADVEPAALTALPAPRRRAFEAALLREGSELPIDPRALGVAIVTLLPTLSQGRPLVLAIDDDQWVDPSSAATLEFALRRLLHLPVLLLLSRRTDGEPAATLDEALNPAEVGRLHLGPLSVGAVQLLLRQRLGIAIPRPTLLRIHEVSGGNPFYALELARASSTDPPRIPTTPLAVPGSLDRLVTARLETLDAPTRNALLLVAAQGRLPLSLLRSLVVAPETLDPARAANVIETSGGVLRFTHPLLATALYQGASPGERRDAHQQLATVIDDPVHRGHHLALAANEPREDLAASLEAAAGVARDRGMPIAEAELAEHSLRLTPVDAIDDRHRRAIATARANWASGEGSRARGMAAALEAAAPPGRKRAEVLILRSEVEPPAVAVALLRKALAEAAGVPELQASIHAGLAEAGWASRTKGRAWREGHARAALRLAERLDDDLLRSTALSVLALVRFDGRDPHALDLAERAYRLALPLADARLLNRALASVAFVMTWSVRAEPAREWLERRMAEWSERDERVRADLLWYLALVELWSGRWSIASDYADQMLEISAQYGMELPSERFPSALIALHRGRFEVARELSRGALSMGEMGEGDLWDFYYAILATCDLWSGDPTAALESFSRAEQAADALGSDEPTMRVWRAEYVEALLQLGRIEEAARLTADWERVARRLRRERVLAQAVRCRGQIAAARGDLVGAVDLLLEAADQHEAAGDPFGRGRALLTLGVVRLRARQKRKAREALETALEVFETLGAASWVAATRAELARVGGRTRIEGLSPSEHRVAALVAEGRTNQEIAAALFIGERTVASHLTHIYAKLGIRSRTELARQLPRHSEESAGGSSKVPTS